jgi:type I restriction enzyme S subunit
MIPEGWKKKSLAQIASHLDAGVSVNSGDRPASEGEFGVLKTSCVSNGTFSPEENKVVLSDIELRRLCEPVIGDSIIISRMNTPALVGANAYVDRDFPNLFLPDRLWQIKAGNQPDCMRWLAYVLASKSGREKLSSFATGTSGSMKNISKTAVLEMELLVPPFAEQRRIAEILSTWDRAIAATEKLIASSQAQKKALMQQLLTGKKRLPGFGGEWEELEFGSLGNTYSGLSGKTKEDFGAGEYLYVPYKNVFEFSSVNFNALDQVNLVKNEKQNAVKHGDIIFTTSSETPEEVGMSSVVIDPPANLYLNSFCFGFRPDNDKKIHPIFSMQFFRSAHMRQAISTLAQGSTRYNLSKKSLLELKLNLPPIPEQTAIASILSNADREIDLQQQKLSALKQEQSALMQQLLTGKRRVTLPTAQERVV